jgi:hypothetical protein
MWTLCILWHFYNSMTCTCIICIVLLWLTPHPIVIWLTYGSMECNKDVCMCVCITFLMLQIIHEFYNANNQSFLIQSDDRRYLLEVCVSAFAVLFVYTLFSSAHLPSRPASQMMCTGIQTAICYVPLSEQKSEFKCLPCIKCSGHFSHTLNSPDVRNVMNQITLQVTW